MAVTNFNVAGNIIIDNGTLRNEFFNTLMNMVARQIVVNNMYDNPWSWPKKGMLDVGDKIEEIYIGLVKAIQYDVNDESYPLQADKPDVKSSFHKLNYQKYYKTRVTDNEVREAFLSIEGFNNFLQKVITNLYTSANYDEFLCYKYITAREILDQMPKVGWIASGTTATDAEKSATIKTTADLFGFMGQRYNRTHVPTFTPAGKKHIIMTAEFKATRDNGFLADVFNLPMADLGSKFNVIDSFAFSDAELVRVNALFADVEGFETITATENATLKTVPCILVDEDFYQIYDVILDMYYNEQLQLQNLNRYLFLHTWKILSTSPYHNAVVFGLGADGTLYALQGSRLVVYTGSGAGTGDLAFTSSTPNAIEDTGYTTSYSNFETFYGLYGTTDSSGTKASIKTSPIIKVTVEPDDATDAGDVALANGILVVENTDAVSNIFSADSTPANITEYCKAYLISVPAELRYKNDTSATKATKTANIYFEYDDGGSTQKKGFTVNVSNKA